MNEHPRQDTIRFVPQPAIEPSQKNGESEQRPQRCIDQQGEEMREEENERLQRIAYQETEAPHEPSPQQSSEKDLFPQGGEEEFVQESDQDRGEAEAKVTIVIQGDTLRGVPIEIREHEEHEKDGGNGRDEEKEQRPQIMDRRTEPPPEHRQGFHPGLSPQTHDNQGDQGGEEKENRSQVKLHHSYS